jgi:cytoskeletal protein RodZ
MWLLVLLVAVSVVVTVVARRRHTDEHDSVDAQQRRLDALRTAVRQHDDPNDLVSPAGGGGIGLATARRTPRDRTSRRSMLGTALIAVAVVIAGVAIYALAAGWDTSSRAADDDAGTADRTAASSSTTTSSTSSTTTTTKPAVPTVLSTENGIVAVSVPSGPYQLHVAATDACWTQIERADGSVVETKTMQTGDVIDLNESGALTIRLGNPAGVQVSVNGTALTLPPSTGDALRVTLVPAT